MGRGGWGGGGLACMVRGLFMQVLYVNKTEKAQLSARLLPPTASNVECDQRQRANVFDQACFPAELQQEKSSKELEQLLDHKPDSSSSPPSSSRAF